MEWNGPRGCQGGTDADAGTSELYIGKQWRTRDKVGGSKLQLYRLTSRMKSYAELPARPSDLPTGSAGIKTPLTRGGGLLLRLVARNANRITSDQAMPLAAMIITHWLISPSSLRECCNMAAGVAPLGSQREFTAF